MSNKPFDYAYKDSNTAEASLKVLTRNNERATVVEAGCGGSPAYRRDGVTSILRLAGRSGGNASEACQHG